MLEVHGLTKHSGALIAIRDVSFTVNPGDVLGLLGPNGSGKSTTVKILILKDGRVVGHDSVANLRATLRLPTLDAVFATLTAEEQVEARTNGFLAAMQA